MANIVNDIASIRIDDGSTHIDVPKNTASVIANGDAIKIKWDGGTWGWDSFLVIESPAGASADAVRALIQDFIDDNPEAAGENHLGAVGGNSKNPSDDFSRPDDTTAYATGDLIANSTTAGDVSPLTFDAARIAAGSFVVMRARLHKNEETNTNAQFRLHLFKSDPTATAPSNGDGDTLELNSLPAGAYLGYFDFNMTSSPDIQASDIELAAAPANGTTITVKLDSGSDIFGLLEARAAYTPASGEVFTATLEVLQD